LIGLSINFTGVTSCEALMNLINPVTNRHAFGGQFDGKCLGYWLPFTYHLIVTGSFKGLFEHHA
jgi:hypothetical protein